MPDWDKVIIIDIGGRNRPMAERAVNNYNLLQRSLAAALIGTLATSEFYPYISMTSDRPSASQPGSKLSVELAADGAPSSAYATPHTPSTVTPMNPSEFRLMHSSRSYTRPALDDTYIRPPSVVIPPASSSPPRHPVIHKLQPKNYPQNAWYGNANYKQNIATGQEWANVRRAYVLAQQYPWFSTGQMACLDNLWANESNFDELNINPDSGAYGIPQSLPGDKMSESGSDWRSGVDTQIRWGLGYIDERYKTPCAAWQHELDVNFY